MIFAESTAEYWALGSVVNYSMRMAQHIWKLTFQVQYLLMGPVTEASLQNALDEFHISRWEMRIDKMVTYL